MHAQGGWMDDEWVSGWMDGCHCIYGWMGKFWNFCGWMGEGMDRWREGGVEKLMDGCVVMALIGWRMSLGD